MAPEEPKQTNPHAKKVPRPKRRVGLWTYNIRVVALGIGVGGTYWLIGRQVNAQLSSMQQTSKAMKKIESVCEKRSRELLYQTGQCE